MANPFLFLNPLENKRWIQVTERRHSTDWALAAKTLADDVYPEANKIFVVLDNLNTHSLQSFYETFPAQEARPVCERFEFHYTPKHGRD